MIEEMQHHLNNNFTQSKFPTGKWFQYRKLHCPIYFISPDKWHTGTNTISFIKVTSHLGELTFCEATFSSHTSVTHIGSPSWCLMPSKIYSMLWSHRIIPPRTMTPYHHPDYPEILSTNLGNGSYFEVIYVVYNDMVLACKQLEKKN